jgi:rRNA-processing protein FCF1
METETIDKLFLELSQVTNAKTRREIELEAEIERLGRVKTLTEHIVIQSLNHGSRRAYGEAIGVDHAYLKRLEDGDKENPSDEVLDKMGLRKQVYYREKITI